MQRGNLVFSYPTVHTQQSSVPAGVAEHNVTVARAFTKLMGAFVTFWDDDAGSRVSLLMNPGTDYAHIGAARVEDSLLESQMQLGSLQYPHNSMKGASEHFHFLSVLAGTYNDTVRNIDISRNAYAGFPTERVPKMPLSGVSTRSGDLARFSFKGLDGTATAIFISATSPPVMRAIWHSIPVAARTGKRTRRRSPTGQTASAKPQRKWEGASNSRSGR